VISSAVVCVIAGLLLPESVRIAKTAAGGVERLEGSVTAPPSGPYRCSVVTRLEAVCRQIPFTPLLAWRSRNRR